MLILQRVPNISSEFETDPETIIILIFVRKLERVPVKLDRPRFERRRGRNGGGKLYLRIREKDGRLPHCNSVEQYVLHSR